MDPLQRFSQLQKCFRGPGVPKCRLSIPVRGSTEVTFLEVLVSDVDVPGGLNRVQRVFLGLERLVLFLQILRPWNLGRKWRRFLCKQLNTQ